MVPDELILTNQEEAAQAREAGLGLSNDGPLASAGLCGLQIAHWSLERAMDRISSAKRKRESPDEDEVAEIQETLEVTRRVVGQACTHPQTPLQGPADMCNALTLPACSLWETHAQHPGAEAFFRHIPFQIKFHPRGDRALPLL